ncbi:endonuclease domain-containing protein [Rhizobium sp. L1K21]|uniref:endonuclease domain-containing protein n=1 Tax=Rhizobium sp. L1K21 TaxID=2954933 RepID=UPI00211ACD8B|nr:DUF559 domain-containing protein [Rhizobium sp. L1K21]
MPHHKPPPKHREYARAMRGDGTKAEALLWNQLKDRRMGGLKFRRQVPLKGYIVDFICFEAKCIIEVDGGQHAESKRDALRDATFAAEGFQTLRFWNDEIENGLDFAVRKIREKLNLPPA